MRIGVSLRARPDRCDLTGGALVCMSSAIGNATKRASQIAVGAEWIRSVATKRAGIMQAKSRNDLPRGGLVVERLLLGHREYAAKVPFIYFYSTPQTGSQMASIAHYLSKDPLLETMFPGDRNLYLKNARGRRAA